MAATGNARATSDRGMKANRRHAERQLQRCIETLEVRMMLSGGPLPAPWQDVDVVTPGLAMLPGSADYDNGVFTVKGSGRDIWDNSDAFHFAYQELTGDFEISTRVASQEETDPWAKSGLMIRESLAGNSVFYDVVATPQHDVVAQWRDTTGAPPGTSEYPLGMTGLASTPVNLKLVRSGHTFSAYMQPETPALSMSFTAPEWEPTAKMMIEIANGNLVLSRTGEYESWTWELPASDGWTLEAVAQALQYVDGLSVHTQNPWSMMLSSVLPDVPLTELTASPLNLLTVTDYTLVNQLELALPNTVYVGMAVTAHNTQQLSTAEFENVQVTPVVGEVLAPTGLDAMGAENKEDILLSWKDNSSNETGFTVRRSTDPTFANYDSIVVPADTTSWRDVGVTQGVRYYYQVWANDESGAQAASNTSDMVGGQISGLMGAYFPTLDSWDDPVAVRVDPKLDMRWSTWSSFKAPVEGLGSTYTITWNGKIQVDQDGAYGLYMVTYGASNVYVDGQYVGGYYWDEARGTWYPPDCWTQPIYLSAGQWYDINIDVGHNSMSAPNSVQLRWIRPDGEDAVVPARNLMVPDLESGFMYSPRNLMVTAVEQGDVVLKWTERSPNETGFVLEKANDPDFTAPVAISLARNQTSYVDTEWDGTPTYYRIRAVNRDFVSDSSNTAMVHMPTAPTDLTAAVMGPWSAALNWTPDPAGDVQYTVERSESGAEGTFQAVDETDGGGLLDSGLNPSQTYYYRLRATNLAGTVTSDVLTVSTPAGPRMYGTGLLGTYYDEPDFQGFSASRVDPTVNIESYVSFSPWPGVIEPEEWSAVWTGWVVGQSDEPYTFYARSDDGVRLWVDDQLLIDSWYPRMPTTDSSEWLYPGGFVLGAGQAHRIRVEYYEIWGPPAAMQLMWSVGGTPMQIIPTRNLYPDEGDIAAVVEIGGASSGVEGAQVELTSAIGDIMKPEGWTYGYWWSVSKDGQAYELPAGTVNTEATFRFTPDDNGVYTVSLNVGYAGGVATASQTTVVGNVAPVVTLGAASGTVEGSAFDDSGGVDDVSAADGAAGLTCSWTVTKNGAPFASGVGTAIQFTPDDDGVYVETLTAVDKDGGTGTASRTIVVSNAVPSAAITGVPTTAIAREAIVLGCDVSDASAADVAAGFSYLWSVTRNGQEVASGTEATLRFVPGASGEYVVSLTVTDKDGGVATDSGTIRVIPAADCALSGMAWVDYNDDGLVDFGEQGIAGITVELNGTDDLGNSVSLSEQTDEDGVWAFVNLRPGIYSVREVQPADCLDGQESLGTAGGSMSNDAFDAVALGENQGGVNYNFGERPMPGSAVQPGQSAGIGFWQNKNGQALITAFDGGGVSTRLGDWLAATFPGMFGTLAGKTNADVAAAYRQRFVMKGPKVDAQMMAAALAVYATNASLGGAWAAAYGFAVSEDGLGVATYNVGSSGAAFGVADGSVMTVLDLLLAADQQAVGGRLYGGDATLCRMANTVFDGINTAGSIG